MNIIGRKKEIAELEWFFSI